MLNRATKIMNKQREEREAAANKCYATISDAQEALKVLGFEVVSADDVIDVTPITINKGQIVKVEVKTKDEELQRAYDELAKDFANRCERIEELKETIEELNDELEIKEGVLNHMKKVHKCEIEELEDKIKELNRRIKTLQMFNDAEDEIFEEQDTMKGGDAVSTPKQQPKRNPLLDKIKKAKEFTLEEAVASAQADAERKAEEKEEAKSKFPKYTLDYEQITFDESMDSRTMFGIRGTITFDEASYFFEATNNHHMPIIYDCYDEDVIRLTKDIIMHEIERFSFMNEREVGAADYRYAKDETFPVVAWRLTDDKGNITYHGYSCTKQYSYILTWDKKFNKNYVGRKLVKNIFSDAPNMWKKLSNKQLADKFMAVCASIWPEDFTNDDNDPEPTKEQHKTTKEFFQITKEQHQTTKEIIWDTPIDNFGETKEQYQSTNEEFDPTADDDLDF